MNKRLHILIWLMALVGWMHPTLAQTDSLCVSSPVNNYYVTPTAGSSYAWDTQGDGVINSGQGTAAVNITWPAVAGTYQLSVTETTADGCTGLPQLLQVVIFPAYYDTTELTVCASALPVVWNGNTYGASGTYNLMLSSIAGCDSIATLVLSVNPLLSPALTCGTSSTSSVEVVWLPVAGATSYLLDYSINGVPVMAGLSVSTTNFAVNSLSPSDVVSFTITPVGVDGCFASASINCTAEDCVPPVVNSSPISQSVCEGESTSFSASVSGASGFQWQLSFDGGSTFIDVVDDLVYGGAGTPTLSISNVTGLDGLIVQLLALEPNGSCSAISAQATLTVNSLPSVQFTASDLVSPPETLLNCNTPSTVIVAVGGVSYVWSGGQTPLQATNTFDTPGTYTVEVENAEGCSAEGSITLTGDFSTFSSSVNVARCAGESYTLPDGSVVDASGIYPVTLQALNGCDSTITTTLNIIPSPNTSQDVSICDAQLPYSWNGNTYTSGGSYSVTLTTTAGCDSVVTLNLTVSPTITASEDVTICDAQLPYSWNGNTYTAGGSYSVTLTTAAGCDSVVTLNLTVSPTITASEDVTICDAQLPYSWNGNTYTSGGSYSVTLSTAAGCDSVVTLNLSVSPSLTTTENISICDAQLPYSWNGNTYTAGGSYSVNLTTAAGCDSVVTLNLTVSPTITASEDVTICDAQLPFSWNGNTYSAAGSYSVMLATAAGCDSVVTLNLTVSPTITASEDVTICDAQLPFSWNGNTYTLGGSYSVNLTTAAGCDSVVTLNLSVSPSLTSTQNINICDAQLPYSWNGNTYTSGGSYSVTLTTAAGCDSVVTLNLSVSPSLTTTENISICDAQLPFSWNGNTYTAGGSYSVTLTTAAGCDSVVTLNLSVSPSIASTENISICDAQLPYSWNGNTYTLGGSYSVTLTTAAGCDSVVTLNLSVSPSLTSTDNISICDAQLPYSWNGNTYTSGGSYSVTLTTTAGCDSVVTLNLTVSPTITASEDVTICDAQLPYSWNGNTYNAGGTYSVTLSTAAGCDSVVTLNLTVSPTITASEDVTICDAQLPYSWNGNTYTSGGSYSVALTTAAGCDSVVTLNLTVSPTITASEDVSICDAQLPFSWNGNSYSAAGSYSVTLTSAAGCDSVVTLNLTVSPTITAAEDVTICDAQLPYNWNGNIYTSGGSYSVTLTTAAGCDSVVTLNLTVSPTITASEDVTICDAQLPYSWNGNIYTSGGSYSVTLTTAAGCDSVVTLNLTVSPTITASEDVTICDAQLPYSWNGNSYSAAGSYSVTLTSAAGCDSVVTLNLTVSPTITAAEDVTICDAQLPYSWNGNTYTASGSYSVTLTTAAGCDSVVTLNLSVSPSLTSTENINICDAQLPYSWNGNSYSAAGSYSISLATAAGCDSVVTLNLTVSPTITASEDVTICDAQLPYSWNGNTYTASGSYSVTLTTAAGCDSVVTLNLSVSPSLTSTDNINICDAQLPYSWNGNTYTSGGSYSVTLTTTAGCDSVVTLNLTVSPTITASEDVTICDAQLPYSWNGNTYNAGGTYSVTLSTAAGCDSVVTLNLTVSPTITASEDVTICDAQLPYSWNGNTYTAGGSYSVTLATAAGCDSVVTLNLSVSPTITATEDVTICDVQLPFSWNGNTYTSGGSYSVTLTTAAGCDSVVTLNLSVSPSLTTTENISICDAQLPFSWNGNSYSAAGSYSVSLTTAAGCDSVVTLNLSVSPSLTSTENINICDAQLPYSWNGNSYSAAGSYSISLATAAGCDSVLTLNLSVSPTITASEDVSICDAQLPYSWNGNTYTAGGSYSVTLTTTAGCDSVVTLNLSVSPSLTTTENISICDAQLPFSWNGNTYTAGGSYSVTLTTAAGCDSVVTLNLSVSPSLTSTDNINICDAQLPYSWNGNTYTSGGSYSVTLTTAAGCDSLVTLNLSVSPSLTSTENINICDAQLPYSWNGNTYTAGGSYSVTLATTAGCDSVVTLNLSVSPSLTSSENINICDAQLPYSWNGNTYTSGGSYSVTLTTAAGCDSVVTLNLNVSPSLTSTDNINICDAQLPFSWNGNTYTAGGSYSVTLTTAAGCDSVVTLNLSVSPSLTSSENINICDAQLPYSWNGNTYTAGGSYSVSLTTAAGCDSVVTLNLSVSPSLTSTENISICDAQLPYIWNGNTYTAGGTYSVTLATSAGCDSVVTLNLNVSPSLTTTENISICDAQLPYNWNGNTYTSGGSYSVTLTTAAGCDSVVTLNLNVSPTITASEDVSICDAQLPFSWNGNTYTAGGSYSVTLTTAAGCDSLVTLNLSVSPTITASEDVTICDAQLPYSWNGNTYTSGGSYSVTLSTAAGCDSVVTLNLNVSPSLTTTENISICDAQLPYSWNGNTYTSGGSYSVTLTTAAGCDSVVTLNLSVSPSLTSTENINICDAQLPFSWNGNTYTSGGSYSVTLTSAAGCDSVVTLNLTVSPTITASEDVTICDAQLPYSWNGNTYTAGGSYSVTLTTAAGCDSVVTLNLTVSPTITASEDVTICDAQLPYNWNGNIYTSGGSYSVTLTTAAGCDSVVTLNLTVSPTITATEDVTICDAQLPYSWNGNAYTAGGSYSVTLTTAAGCDSVVTLNLNVSPSLTSTENINICDAQLPYSWNGNTYTAGGSYSVTLATAAGCDSVVTLNLSVSPSLTSTENISICDAQLPYSWNGNTYTAGGSYSVTLTTAAGCDSVVTLNLSVSPSLTSTENINICDAQLPYSWNGNTYTAGGSYSVTLATTAGCDSVVTLNLSVSPSLTSTDNINICDAQLPYSWNGNTYTSGGSYSVTLTTAAGCDSVVTLNLTVSPTITASEDVSICDAQLPYSWNGNIYTSGGSYSVTLTTAAGCDSVVTLNLSVSPTITASEDVSICDAQLPYSWNGNTYTLGGSYSVTLTTAAGCDSLVTLNLSVSPSLTSTDNINICDAQLPYSWNGNTYTSGGSYSVTLTTAAGCDSVVTLNLSVSPSLISTENISICDAQLPYSWNGNSYSAAGSYSVTLTTAAGCDSVVTLNLTVSPTITASEDVTICDAQLPYSWNGNSYSAAGSYSISLTTAAGCDSVVTLNLTVSPTITASEDVTICDAQLPYSWNGNTYTAGGSYSVNLTTAAGCDSVVTLNLTVSPTITASEDVTICDAQLPYSWNGNTYTAGGSYSVTLTTAAGCDSVVTLNLNVSPSLTSTENISICDAQLPYNWNGNTYTSGGSYSVTLTTAAGCDSVVTLNLSVSPSLTSTDNINICDAQLPYSWNGNTYTAGGSYSVTLATAAGCDSVVTLNLSVSPSLTSTENINICDAQLPYSWNGNTYTAGGSYSVTLATAAGCDSVVTLNLSVSPSLTSTDNINICDAQLPYSWNGNTYTSGGSYSVTLTTAAGCDSVVTLNLTVSPTITASEDVTICDAQLPYSWNGNTYTAGGSYSVTLTTAAGCDSVVTLNLTVSPTITASEDVTICDAQLPYSWNGNTYTSGGSYSVTLTTAAGCDSVVTLNLSVSPSLTSSENINICDAQLPYSWNGNTYTSGGSYSVNLTTAAGCDSLVTLNLSVSPSLTSTENISICDAQLPYSWNGNTYSAGGSYSVTLTTAAGCDSVVTLNLTVSPTITTSENVTICDAQLPYSWNGNTYTSGGSYSANLTNAAGCDSVVTLNLTVSPTITASEDVSICDAQLPYSWNGNTYTSGGSYSVTLTTAAGCDSLVTLNLSINSFSTGIDVINSCTSITWIDGNTYSSSNNSATFTITNGNAQGCDSVITLNLTITPALTSTQNVSICSGSTYTLPDGTQTGNAGVYTSTLQTAQGCDSIITTTLSLLPVSSTTTALRFCAGNNFTLPWGEVVNSPGTYTQTLSSAAGCDSILIVNLSADQPINMVISQDTAICSGQSLQLNVSGATNYFWTPGSSLSDSLSATVLASPTINTTYTVVGTQGACLDTATVEVTVLPSPQPQISASPNPICFGDSALVQASGATSYLWQGLDVLCDTCSTFWISPDSTISLQLLASTGICSTTETVSINVLPRPIATISGDTSLCFGDTLLLTASGGGTYVWSNGTDNDTLQYLPLNSTFVSVFVSNGVCQDTATVAVMVNPLPVVDAGTDTTIYFGGTASLLGAVNANATWYPAHDLSCTDCFEPLSTTPFTETYCLTAVNAYGCISTDCVEITVDTLCAGLFLPNVFAPDEGGHNENNCFRLYGADCVSTMTLNVFNRWGEKVYESRNPGDCWDGTFRGQQLNTGVYVFYLEAKLITGETLNRQGNLTLIR